MGFKAVKNDGGLMKAGDYECYLKSCGYSVTKNGNECIKFDFVVREDVEQEYQKKHIFKNFWPDRDTGEYDADKIGKYANALGIEPGTDFELDDLVGRKLANIKEVKAPKELKESENSKEVMTETAKAETAKTEAEKPEEREKDDDKGTEK